MISIHAPAKGATRIRNINRGCSVHFNPRSREGSDRPQYRTIIHSIVYFNPRSREGSDDAPETVYFVREISIHAPAKGATQNSEGLTDHVGISIHAPAKGATRGTAPISGGIQISIHAPAKGATRQKLQTLLCTLNFNPRSREGSDVKILK